MGLVDRRRLVGQEHPSGPSGQVGRARRPCLRLRAGREVLAVLGRQALRVLRVAEARPGLAYLGRQVGLVVLLLQEVQVVP